MDYKSIIIKKIEERIDVFFDNRKKQLEFWKKWNEKSDAKIVVFGAALMGEKVCGYLEKLGVEVDSICDNNPTKYGSSFVTPKNKSIPIMSPEEALERLGDICVIIATGFQFVDEIEEQLKKYNVKNVFKNRYLDFYLETMIVFLATEKEEVLDKIVALLDYFEDEESLKICWCHLKEMFGIEDDIESVSFESTCMLPQYFFDGGDYLGRQDVMVDCGAYIGDTIASLVEEVEYNNFNEYICFELDGKNYATLKTVVDNMKLEVKNKITTHNLGVGREKKQIKYNFSGGNSAAMNNGNLIGEVVALDEFLAGKNVSFLKMDIEGYEQEALYGAQNIIKVNKPICAICIYHSVWDFFEIPALLKKFIPEYHLTLKNHSEEWCDTVCYAKIDK